MKNYSIIFHTRFAANDFTRKRLKNFTKLHFFFTENKLHKNENIFHKTINKIHKNRTLEKKKPGWTSVSILFIQYIST